MRCRYTKTTKLLLKAENFLKILEKLSTVYVEKPQFEGLLTSLQNASIPIG